LQSAIAGAIIMLYLMDKKLMLVKKYQPEYFLPAP